MQDPATPPARVGTPARSRTGTCALGPRRASATPRGRRVRRRPPTSLLPIHSPAGGFRRPGRSAVPMPSHADLGSRTYSRPRRRPRGGAGAARPSSLPRCRFERTASPRPSLASRAVTLRTRRAGAYGYPLEPSSPGLDIALGATSQRRTGRLRIFVRSPPKRIRPGREGGVGLAGFEPARSCARGRRATRLPNRPMKFWCGREDLHLHGPEPDGFSDRRVFWVRHARANEWLALSEQCESKGTVGRNRTSTGRSPPRSERGASSVPPRPLEDWHRPERFRDRPPPGRP